VFLHADVRARRTTLSGDGRDDTDSDNRIYRLNVGYDGPGDGWRFAVGRQVSPELANVSVYDGASFAFDRRRWSAGGFTGTQPDGSDYGYSSDVREHGAFFQFRSKPGASRRWSLGTGTVASYEDSEVNREFVFVQGRYAHERLTVFATQEIDVNRSWKEDVEDDSIDPTSTFVSLNLRATDSLRLRAGYDNRRNIRLYRDVETPETEFDDDFRRGLWAAVSRDAGRHVRLGVEARTYDGGGAGDADSWSANLSVHRLTSRNFSARIRVTTYENERLEGRLYAADASLHVSTRVDVGLSGGLRDDENLINPLFDDDVSWFGVDLDVHMGRALYLTLWLERAEGDFEEVDQAHATLAWRF
jgi:hypothetical protein